MKKRITAILIAASFVLSACSSYPGAIVAPPSGEASGDVKEEGSPEPETSEDAKTQEAPEEKTEAEQEDIKLPVYKLVSNYMFKVYEGEAKEDGEGNSLEGVDVFQGLAQVVMVSDESRELYPDLYRSLNEASTASLNDTEATAEEYIQSALEDAQSAKERELLFNGPYSYYKNISVARADSKVLSFWQYYSGFLGGAHALYGRTGYTYDVTTGKLLALTDVVDTTEDKLIPVIKEKILEYDDAKIMGDMKMTSEEEEELDEKLSDCYKLSADPASSEAEDKGTSGFDWYLDPEGIHFYFGPYDIAPYVLGDFDIFIGYDEFPGTVNEQYLPDNNNGYIVYSDIPMVDSSWDDENDTSLHFVYDADDPQYNNEIGIACSALTLRKGNRSATAEDEYFTYNYDKNFVKQYKVVTADGREYIYVAALTESDYTDIMVFDLNDDDIRFSGVYTCHLAYDDTNSDYEGEFIPNDPENMYLAQVGNLFGTYICYGRYVVGDDGMPEPADNVFKISWGSEEARSLKDIKVTLLDDDQNELGEETVKAGEHFLPVRTDNSTYMDCRLDDGRYVRLKYSKTDIPAEINGESVDDLFEDLAYAG